MPIFLKTAWLIFEKENQLNLTCDPSISWKSMKLCSVNKDKMKKEEINL
jgi:hypothetical protein